MSDDPELHTMSYLLASARNALVGEVTPELRAVTAWLGESEVRCRFIFDTSITAEMIERVEDAETEIVADYWGALRVSCVAEHVPIEQAVTLREGELWAFLRWEPKIKPARVPGPP